MRKLGEIKGDAAIEVLADLFPPSCGIVQDKNILALFNGVENDEGADRRTAIFTRLRENVPALLKAHKAEVIEILAALEGMPAEAYKAVLTFPKLTADLTSFLTDQTALELFTSAVTETQAPSSGAASETTQGR